MSIMNAILIGLSIAIGLSCILVAPNRSLTTLVVGKDLKTLTADASAFSATLVFDYVPQSFFSRLASRHSIKWNLALHRPFERVRIPNYGSQFHVDGIEDSRIKWFTEAENRTPSDPVIIFIHGGGFVFGLSSHQITFLRELYERVDNPRLSILILDYHLSSEAHHPTQLIQLIEVFNELSKTCDNIWLMGDSAGGTLSLQFLRHAKHPVDNVPAPATNNVKGVVLLSPWVNLHPNKTGTYLSNHGRDITTAYALSGMGELYEPDIATLESDALNLYKDTIDWDEVLPDHSKVFVSMGGNEVLRGDIESFVQNARLDDATVYTEPRGLHDSLIIFANNNPVVVEAGDFLKREL